MPLHMPGVDDHAFINQRASDASFIYMIVIWDKIYILFDQGCIKNN